MPLARAGSVLRFAGNIKLGRPMGELMAFFRKE
jgi:hypothetical protein